MTAADNDDRVDQMVQAAAVDGIIAAARKGGQDAIEGALRLAEITDVPLEWVAHAIARGIDIGRADRIPASTLEATVEAAAESGSWARPDETIAATGTRAEDDGS